MSMKVLNVGCGVGDISEIFPEGAKIVRMDSEKKVRPDVLHDIEKPMPKKHYGQYDVVFARHVLEHVSWKKVDGVVKDFVRCLVEPDPANGRMAGGELWVIVPSLEWVGMELMRDNPSIAVMGALFGSQDAKGQYHKSGFMMMWLREIFERQGLVVRKAYQDWFWIDVNGDVIQVAQNNIIGVRVPNSLKDGV